MVLVLIPLAQMLAPVAPVQILLLYQRGRQKQLTTAMGHKQRLSVVQQLIPSQGLNSLTLGMVAESYKLHTTLLTSLVKKFQLEQIWTSMLAG